MPLAGPFIGDEQKSSKVKRAKPRPDAFFDMLPGIRLASVAGLMQVKWERKVEAMSSFEQHLGRASAGA